MTSETVLQMKRRSGIEYQILLAAEIAAAANCDQSMTASPASMPHKAALSTEAFEGCRTGTVGKASCRWVIAADGDECVRGSMEDEDEEQQGSKITISGLTLAAAATASVMRVDTTQTGGLEGMHRMRIADEFLVLRGGKMTGPIDSKDSNIARLLLLAPDSLPQCRSITTTRGESSVEDTPSTVARDVACI